MKLLSRVLNTLPKRIVVGATVALAFVLPVAVSAAQDVSLSATTGVANVTAGDTTYKSAVNATYDQVVKVEVTYTNNEAVGSSKVAKNMDVKINIPTTAGKTQKITTTTKADNGDATKNGTVTVNLDRSDAYLQYIPNSAVWKYADNSTGSPVIKEKSISDAVTTTGVNLGDLNPCQSGSVTVLARVMVPGVKIVKQSEVLGQTNKWSNDNTAKPGDTLKYMITYQNTGNTTQNSVVIRDSLPPKMTLVAGSTYLYNSTNPNGVKYDSDNITNGGIVIGNYAPGAGAYVVFEVKVPAESALACGDTEFRNVGVAHPSGMNEYYNTAITNVSKTCTTPTTKTPTCDLLTVTKKSGREIEAKVSSTANGATLKTVTYDFGDNSTPLTTDKTDVTYTYAKDGNYTVSASLLFSVDGKDQTVSSASCAKAVSFTTPSTPTTPTTPTTTELPNTGAGDVIGLFVGASIAGGVAYRLFLGRRLARQ